LAESSNWPLIQRDGLLSATRLLAAAGLAPADRERLQRAQRLQHTELPNQVHIRDQGPMPPAALERCLCGMTPSDWYSAVNARVFFWLDPARLNRQRAACGARPQVVMIINAQALVAAYEERVAVTPINTGLRRASGRSYIRPVRRVGPVGLGKRSRRARFAGTKKIASAGRAHGN